MKDRILRGVLFGESSKLADRITNRVQTITMPSLNGEPYRHYEWGRDDGFVMVLIRMIEKLEKEVDSLKKSESKKIKTK